MKPFPPIENDDEHAAALVKFDELMGMPEKDRDIPVVSELAYKIEEYERKRWPIPEVSDGEMEKWRCENVRGYEAASGCLIVVSMILGQLEEMGDFGENKKNNHHSAMARSGILSAHTHLKELVRRLQTGETP